jgi:hypothetical protein
MFWYEEAKDISPEGFQGRLALVLALFTTIIFIFTKILFIYVNSKYPRNAQSCTRLIFSCM